MHITGALREKDYSVSQKQNWKPVTNYMGERSQIAKGSLCRKNKQTKQQLKTTTKTRFRAFSMKLDKFELRTTNLSVSY